MTELADMEGTQQPCRDSNSTHVSHGKPSSGAQRSNPMWKVLGISRCSYWGLVCLNYLGISAVCAANMLSRFYFAHGGSRRWISSWLQSVGFPILFVPLIACYRRKSRRPFKSLSPNAVLVCCGMGVLLGVDNFMFAWGISYLSVSTYSLLSASQLAFNSLFAFLIVRQRFGSSTVNCIVLLTLSSVLVGFSSGRERAEGVSGGEYVVGILTTIGAAAVYGLILPLMELIYVRMKCRMTYVVVLEMQVVMAATATVFSTVGMWVNGDFGGMYREAREDFDVGQAKYYMTILWTAISWQLFFVGTAGMIFLTTSLVSGILMSALLPASLVTAVIFFHDNFNGEKAVAMMLSLWGFASYLYGEYRNQQQPPQAKPCEAEGNGDNHDVNNKQSQPERELDVLVDDMLSADL